MEAPTTIPAAPDRDIASNGVVTAGYITAVLIPFVGVIIGIVLMVKRRMGHGIGVMVVSVIAFWIAFALLLGSASSTASSELDSYTTCIDAAQSLAQMDKC